MKKKKGERWRRAQHKNKWRSMRNEKQSWKSKKKEEEKKNEGQLKCRQKGKEKKNKRRNKRKTRGWEGGRDEEEAGRGVNQNKGGERRKRWGKGEKMKRKKVKRWRRGRNRIKKEKKRWRKKWRRKGKKRKDEERSEKMKRNRERWRVRDEEEEWIRKRGGERRKRWGRRAQYIVLRPHDVMKKADEIEKGWKGKKRKGRKTYGGFYFSFSFMVCNIFLWLTFSFYFHLFFPLITISQGF